MISRDDSRLRRYNGRLSPADETRIQARLDELSQSIRWMRRN